MSTKKKEVWSLSSVLSYPFCSLYIVQQFSNKVTNEIQSRDASHIGCFLNQQQGFTCSIKSKTAWIPIAHDWFTCSPLTLSLWVVMVEGSEMYWHFCFLQIHFKISSGYSKPYIFFNLSVYITAFLYGSF